MKRIATTLALALLFPLLGCQMTDPWQGTPLEQQKNSESWIEIASGSTFSLYVPPMIQERIERDDGSLAFVTYDTSTIKRKMNDFAVYVYILPPSNCHNMGKEDELNRLVQERTEVYDKENDMLIVHGIQRPTLPEVDMSEEDLREHMASQTTKYLFCSIHKGKEINIVLSQVTNNPELAEKIFSTFRWTD